MICNKPGRICYGSEGFGLSSLHNDDVGFAGATATATDTAATATATATATIATTTATATATTTAAAATTTTTTNNNNNNNNPVLLLSCYGCIFHGTENSPQLCQNFEISGRGYSAMKSGFRSGKSR
jgi:hypothetical protein